MDAQVLARWQFGITTVYHFFFVPITIGLTWTVAVMQTMWLRTKNEDWLKLTKFFAKLFLINFVAGVVTGIVQEFQFGMNWSEYSRFVGDIFGAPLALEALITFFLESTFIGLWIFGWDKLKPAVHNMCMYLTAIGSSLSAVFILAANMWMQNPVGATYRNGRAELTDFSALFTNPFFLVTIPHQFGASFMVAGALVLGIAGWKLQKRHRDARAEGIEVRPDTSAWRMAAKFGAWMLLVASLLTYLSGDWTAKVETKLQPMKLAASEGHMETTAKAGFTIVGIYTQERGEDGITKVTKVWGPEVPYVLSILAFNDPNAEVKGIEDLTREYVEDGWYAHDGTRNQLQEEFAGSLAELNVDPVPNVMVAFYSFRLMMGLGFLGTLASIWALIALRHKKKDGVDGIPPLEGFGGGFWKFTFSVLPFLPLLANTFGWILTEMGRQPWIVNGVLPTWTAVSPTVSTGAVLFSTILYTLVYLVVAVVVVKLFFVQIGKGLPEEVKQPELNPENEKELYFAY